MTPQKQLHTHEPDKGQVGDCWRTSIACLLDLSPSEVPHFVADSWNDPDEVKRRTMAWLNERGLSYVETAYDCPLDDVLRVVGNINPGMHYLLGGNSRSGVGHSVICLNSEIVWDPSTKDVGIVGPMDDGYFWVTWLVPSFLSEKAA